MKQYFKVHSSTQPMVLVIGDKSVQINTNIQPYTESIDGYTIDGFEYDCTEYTKDEYLVAQDAKIASLQEELAAAKILLGVD